MKVVALYQYPIKSLRGIPLEACPVDRNGLVDDRRWMVVDKSGKFQTIREHPVMTQIDVEPSKDGLVLRHAKFGSATVAYPNADSQTRITTVWKHVGPAHTVDMVPNNFLSNIFGQEMDLVYLSDPKARPVTPEFSRAGDYTNFSDEFPILLTSTASLAELNKNLEVPVLMQRFRPNIVIDGEIPWGEDTWKVIQIGSLKFRVAKPCSRCVVTTRDHLTGEQTDALEPLQTLGKIHRASNGTIMFGQNIIPDDIGKLKIGDNVEVLKSGTSNIL